MAKRGRVSKHEGYLKYVDQYTEKQRKLAKEGIMINSPMLTEVQFKETYGNEYNDRKKAIKRGERKTTGNIIRDLVDEQAYKVSMKQAKAQREAYIIQEKRDLAAASGLDPDTEDGLKYMEKLNVKVTLKDIRTGIKGVNWSEITTDQHEMRDAGIDWETINEYIAQTYFGSE